MKKGLIYGFVIAFLVIAIAVETVIVLLEKKPWEKKEENSAEATATATTTTSSQTNNKTIPEDEEFTVESDYGKITVSKKYYAPQENDVVYTYMKATVGATDFNGDLVYNVPQINLNTSYAEKMNEEIMKIYTNEVDNFIKQKKQINMSAEGLEYEYYINGDVLSIIMELPSESGGQSTYYAFNLDVDGIKVSIDEILEEANVNASDFNSILLDKIKNLETYNIANSNGIEDYETMINSVLNSTLERYKNMEASELDIYLNEKGNLCVILLLDVIAGSGQTNSILDLNTGKLVVI